MLCPKRRRVLQAYWRARCPRTLLFPRPRRPALTRERSVRQHERHPEAVAPARGRSGCCQLDVTRQTRTPATPGADGTALHGAIDDATGTDLVLVFRATDDLHGYGILLQKLCTAYGCP